MTGNPKRPGLLAVAFAILALALVACQAPATSVTPLTNNAVTTFHTPSPESPTPTFPPFTVGTWPSNYSPGNNDTITIYVICRVQPKSMDGPPTPPQQHLNVTIVLNGPISGTYSGTTDDDGLAAIPITINDPYSGKPVTVVATVDYNGQSFKSSTFFTPSPSVTPSPTGGASKTPGAGGSTPTATP